MALFVLRARYRPHYEGGTHVINSTNNPAPGPGIPRLYVGAYCEQQGSSHPVQTLVTIAYSAHEARRIFEENLPSIGGMVGPRPQLTVAEVPAEVSYAGGGAGPARRYQINVEPDLPLQGRPVQAAQPNA